MRKIRDALKKAFGQRFEKTTDESTRSEGLDQVAEQVSEEIQRRGTSFTPSDGCSKADATPNGRAGAAEHGKRASAASTTSVGGSGNGHRHVNGGSVAPEVCEQAIKTCQAKFLHAEEQTMQRRWEEVSLRARVEEYQRLLEQTEAELKYLQKCLDTTAQATAAAETAWAEHLKQLASLRECQALVHAARMAEEELEAIGQIVATMIQSRERGAEELAHYQKRHERLRRTVEQFEERLGEALVQADAANGVSGVEPSARQTRTKGIDTR